MIIDFDKIPEAHLTNFKGGKGPLDTRNYVDDKVKIMYSTLRPGASSGLHTHEQNCEIVYVISGEATFHYDDQVEVCRVGQCHYCPMGHSHYMENRTDHDLVYLAIVPEHKVH
ncbi:MAG: cupin domain-containing protein [Prevotella sp.]|jgi:mannose-6-phosphate isomerase-like protein (cupin superfamily)